MIVKRGEKLQKSFYKHNKIDERKLKEYYDWVDRFVADEYAKIGNSHSVRIN